MTKLLTPDTCSTCAHYHSHRCSDGINQMGRCHSWRAHPGELHYRMVKPGDPCCPHYVPRGIGGAEPGW